MIQRCLTYNAERRCQLQLTSSAGGGDDRGLTYQLSYRRLPTSPCTLWGMPHIWAPCSGCFCM